MISTQDVEEAQDSWAKGIIQIGQAPTWEESKALAISFVQAHYLVEGGTLLFCPTRAARQQFRKTLKDAVSYFVGGDSDHGEDHGFALERWNSVRFENAGVVIGSDNALAMGNYFFARSDGPEVKVEYSFVYVRDSSGRLVIQLHHSAMPFGS